MVRNFQAHAPVENPAKVRLEKRQGKVRLIAEGDWITAEVSRLDGELHALDFGSAGEAEIDGSGLTALDSAGAWLLLRSKREFEDAGVKVTSFDMPDRYKPLLDTM
ncbi:MAG TPA: STAS domain-containing protein, partial [Rhizomicrobium sp.]|nr:STAS domain-containing protein [Rhizomicrobium sp.]